MKKASSNRATTVGIVDPDILEFTAGEDPALDIELVEADCLGTAAHVTMLSRLPVTPPILNDTELRQVVVELARIVAQARAGAFRITMEDQDVHLAVERVLTEKLGDLGRKVHTGRSRNDQVAVDLRLAGKDRLLDILAAVRELIAALLQQSEKHAKVPMVGRTHMQPAMPSSVGLWAGAHAESLLDDAALLIAAYELNDQCPLGSAASYGVPLPLDRQGVSDLLGFRRPIHNVLYANNARGKNELGILNALGQVMLSLSRLAQDLILFGMPEFGYFSLPDEFCTGSSIMPQKKNPDVLELVRARAAGVQAAAGFVAEIVRAAPSGYNRDLQEAKGPFLKGLKTTLACVRIMKRVVEGLRVNEAALRKAFTPDVFATDQALELVAGGMPFRRAYDHVKSHLPELESADPDRALARKTHLGAPAGLDFAALFGRVDELANWLKDEQETAGRAKSCLLQLSP